jgi:indole-3-glycerol phosphate synthase
VGSTPTDDAAALAGAAVAISSDDLAAVPGALGRLARSRAVAYAAAPAPQPHLPARTAPGRFAAVLDREHVAVIAEVKRASPSQGAIADIDPVRAARDFVEGGAVALSVLTEPTEFGGSLEHLQRVSEAVDVPVMRKDFVVHPRQLVEAREHGASAVLLIVAVLGERLAAYRALAARLGLDALVEVHDEAELDLAIGAGADLIGVNNRDLRDLSIDLATAPRLIAAGRALGHEARWVAESGYTDRDQVVALEGVADAVLVGTSLARAGDLAAAVRALRGREP